MSKSTENMYLLSEIAKKNDLNESEFVQFAQMNSKKFGVIGDEISDLEYVVVLIKTFQNTRDYVNV